MTPLRRLSRQRALALAGLVAVATPMLSSCGFDYATDRPNTIANGGYHIDGDVHVLAARIITPAAGSGTFVATITVDPQGKPVTVTGVSGKGLSTGSFKPVEVPSSGMVNLFKDGGVPVSGDFTAGQNLPVSVEFSNGDSIDVDAIVVKQCYEYADVQGQSQASAGGSKAASASPSAEPTGAPYSCDYASAPAEGSAH